MYKPAWANHQRIKNTMDERLKTMRGRFGQGFIDPTGTQGVDWQYQIPQLSPGETAAAAGGGRTSNLEQEIVRLQQQNAALLQQVQGQPNPNLERVPEHLRDQFAPDAVFYDPRGN